MSRENLELVARALRAATAQPKPDFATMNALYHPDHVFLPLVRFGTGDFRGGRGYQAFLEQEGQAGLSHTAGQAPVSWEADFEGAVDVGPNKVLGVATARYRGSASGAEVEQRTWIVATVRDGRVAQTELYSDSTEALEAVGLRE